MSLQRFSSIQPDSDLPELRAVLEARQRPAAEGGRGSWYTITNVSSTEAEIAIYDEIGQYGVTASAFIAELKALKAKQITLYLNSPGGQLFDGLAMYNALRRHPAQVDVIVDSLAASAASFIAMAGDTVTMAPHSQMMIHDAMGLVIGNAADMREMADFLDKSSDNLAAIYAGKAGGTVEEWRERMRVTSWFSDREAVEAGLADRVEGDDETPRNVVSVPLPEPTPDPEPEPQPAESTPVARDWRAFMNEQVRNDPWLTRPREEVSV